MHPFVCLKDKFPYHFAFTFECYFFLLLLDQFRIERRRMFDFSLALSVGQRLYINFSVSRANFLSCYLWSSSRINIEANWVFLLALSLGQRLYIHFLV